MLDANMCSLLHELAKSRPIFHSEADFQHALAWKLHERHPHFDIRLEYRPPLAGRIYIDVWAKAASQCIALELKYKTRRLSTVANGEAFDLADHAAQDLGRYDTIKDICRLEKLVEANPTLQAYAILLTNDSAYWCAPGPKETVAAAFRLNEGRALQGDLAWSTAAGPGTTKLRDVALRLCGSYNVQWRDYSTMASKSYSRFRYFLAQIR